MRLYFVYDPENNGYNEFKSKVEAEEFAKSCIDPYIDDEWDEDAVEQIIMGEVYSKAKKYNILLRPPEEQIDEDSCDTEGNYWDEWKYKCNYKMTPV